MAANGYQGRIGRFTPALAEAMISRAGVKPGDRVLDVGCGDGALTEPLSRLLGADSVVGVDPSSDDLVACAKRVPGVHVVAGVAESLPFEDDEFDACLAQLVVTLMDDAPAGAAEMRRVTRTGGSVSACAWDFAEGMTPLRAFWDAARAVDPDGAARHDQSVTRPYADRGELEELWKGAGLTAVESGELLVSAGYAGFDELWEPMTVPDGGPGPYCQTLSQDALERIREEMFRLVGRPDGTFRLSARAWHVIGVV